MQRLLRVELTALFAATLLTGIAAVGAAAAPVKVWPIAHLDMATQTARAVFTRTSQPIGDKKTEYRRDGDTVTTFAKFRVTLVRARDGKVLKSFTDSWYRAHYVEWHLTDQDTGFPLTKVRSYKWLSKLYDRAMKMSVIDLTTFSNTHY